MIYTNTKRICVEDCEVININHYIKENNKVLYWMMRDYFLQEGFIDVDYKFNGSIESQRVLLDKTICNYGNFRPWFRCPNCDKRVAALYNNCIKAGLFCRKCLGLKYKSQQDHAAFFKIKILEEKRKKLVNKFNRKGIHHKTACDLYQKITNLDTKIYEEYVALKAMLDKNCCKGLERITKLNKKM